jgi:hypothetical protein
MYTLLKKDKELREKKYLGSSIITYNVTKKSDENEIMLRNLGYNKNKNKNKNGI